MTTFAELGLPRPVVAELQRQGFTSAFPIQEKTIPDALQGRDLLGRGPTGSGKTLAFGLPMLARLAGHGVSRPGKPRGLIIAPTRELAQQIHSRLDDLGAVLGLRLLCFVGGVNIQRQIRQLARPVDVLVATPGRALDLVRQGKLMLDDVHLAVLDEADQMADMGFVPQVRGLLSETAPDGQRLFFSATLDSEVDALVHDFLRDPVTHSTAPATAAVGSMRHVVVNVGSRERRNAAVERIAAREGKTILFMRTKHGVDRQVKKLRRVGINALPLHGNKSQAARERALSGFRSGDVPVVVATDIAARGIDVQDVSLVVHVDPPAEHKAYLHRAGRTARAGAAGSVVTLMMQEQAAEVDALLSKAGVKAERIDISTAVDDDAALTDDAFRAVTGASATAPHGRPLPPPGESAKSTPDNTGRKSPHRRGRKRNNNPRKHYQPRSHKGRK